MPNIKSAKKRVLVSKRRNAENVAKKSRVKNAIKKYNAAIEAKDVALAEAAPRDRFHHRQSRFRRRLSPQHRGTQESDPLPLSRRTQKSVIFEDKNQDRRNAAVFFHTLFRRFPDFFPAPDTAFSRPQYAVTSD